ncbi:hypothetical protein O0L34_g16040 [Tuta absoluta]|nr:hypothetical protein O0L34_g16040 [Tuta absoluta]
MITKKVREAFSTEFIRFCRSIGLPPRKPLTHCTWFKSRTGPSWGIRQNWTRSDVLRWMKIINSEPLHLDHWDLVWHWPPDFPKTMFAGIPRAASQPIPHYQLRELPPCREYMVPRKFRLQHNIPADQQFIWMEHGPGSPAPTDMEMSEEREEEKNEALKRSLPKAPTIPKPTRLDPPIIDPTGLTGRDLILARRLMPRKKFMS